MKHVSKMDWENYKNSPQGKECLMSFDRLTDLDTPLESLFELACVYDKEYCGNMNSKEKQQCVEGLTYYDEEISGIISETEELKNEGTYIDFTVLSHYLLADNADQEFGEISQKKFKAILGDNVLLSIALARHFPEYYIPNFFAMQFYYLKKIAKKYEFDLPNIPIRSDYKGRWLYYNEMCKILNEFAIENDIQSLSELCTFLYGYEVSKINEEMAVEHDKPMPKIPEQAWILVGNYGDGEKTMKEGVWQSNQFTCKGDIMLFYEKSPVKKLNAVWTALEDGFIDPFGPYYSYSIIGNKIEIPNEQAITFKDFKDCEYFKKENRGPEGNFVSKNFQDVSGWSVTSSDYKEIKRLLEAKGFDTSLLPSLYEPKGLSSLDVFNEEDVYNKLLTPLLEEMGWKKGKDFIQEVEFAAGHTTTKHPSNKRPDYCLHPYRIDNKIYSKVVIEAKYFIKSIEELEATFDQCLSYASWGKARVIVLCDKTKILVYEQDRNGLFHKDHHHEPFRWENMKNLEKFNELKRMLDI